MDFVKNRVLQGLFPAAEQIRRLSESLSMARALTPLQRELCVVASVGDVIASTNRMQEDLRLWQVNYGSRVEQMTREMERLSSMSRLFGLGEQFTAIQRAVRPLIPLRFPLLEPKMPMMLKIPNFDLSTHLDEDTGAEDRPHERPGFLDREGRPKK